MTERGCKQLTEPWSQQYSYAATLCFLEVIYCNESPTEDVTNAVIRDAIRELRGYNDDKDGDDDGDLHRCEFWQFARAAPYLLESFDDDDQYQAQNYNIIHIPPGEGMDVGVESTIRSGQQCLLEYTRRFDG